MTDEEQAQVYAANVVQNVHDLSELSFAQAQTNAALNAEIRELRAAVTQMESQIAKAAQERDQARAQLAAAPQVHPSWEAAVDAVLDSPEASAFSDFGKERIRKGLMSHAPVVAPQPAEQGRKSVPAWVRLASDGSVVDVYGNPAADPTRLIEGILYYAPPQTQESEPFDAKLSLGRICHLASLPGESAAVIEEAKRMAVELDRLQKAAD